MSAISSSSTCNIWEYAPAVGAVAAPALAATLLGGPVGALAGAAFGIVKGIAELAIFRFVAAPLIEYFNKDREDWVRAALVILSLAAVLFVSTFAAQGALALAGISMPFIHALTLGCSADLVVVGALFMS